MTIGHFHGFLFTSVKFCGSVDVYTIIGKKFEKFRLVLTLFFKYFPAAQVENASQIRLKC